MRAPLRPLVTSVCLFALMLGALARGQPQTAAKPVPAAASQAGGQPHKRRVSRSASAP